MMDVIILGFAFGLFALAIGYAHVPETPPSRTTARCCQKL